VIWLYESGGLAVWEIEHLFGFEVIFGAIQDGHHCPVRWASRSQELDHIDRARCRSALHRWEDGDWSRITSVLADFAAEG